MNDPENIEEIETRAKALLDGHSRSYVEDAKLFAPVVLTYVQLKRDFLQMNKNLTSVQNLSGTQLEEIRRLQKELKTRGK